MTSEREFLERFAHGLAPGPAPVLADAPPLKQLRDRADILRRARGPLRPLQTELFRWQNEFNHLLVDLLEDRPWYADLGAPRLEAHWREQVPRHQGRRGRAVHAAKTLTVRLSVRTQQVKHLLSALEHLNGALDSTLRDPEQWPTIIAALDALPDVPGLLPLIAAQRDFAEDVARLAELHGPQLQAKREGEPASRPARLAQVSVLLVGEGPHAKVDALETLVENPAQARGTWVLRLPAGERLIDVQGLAEALSRTTADLVYGDSWVNGQRQLKPAWSPEYVLNENYIGGCFAMRAKVVRAAGLTHEQPALAWLLAPRFSAARVERLPIVLSARDEPADVRDEAAVVRRFEPDALVEELEDRKRVVHFKPRPVLVSIIVPFRDKPELLKGLWDSLTGFDAGLEWELILMSNNSRDPATARYLDTLKDPRVSVHHWDHEFNFSTINNEGARLARGDVLLFLNNDVEIRQRNWLAELVGYLQRPGVSAVGARLVYGDGSLQHAGVIAGLKGLAGHAFARWRQGFGKTAFGRPDVTRNWSAVTGACLLMSRARFQEIGGFDKNFRISGGDIELCLRACHAGGRVVCVGHVELAHFESSSRGREAVPLGDVRAEVRAYLPLLLTGDPYAHPLLAMDSAAGFESLRVEAPAAHAVRVIVPWVENASR